MIWRRWINSFTVFTIHRTTKDLNKSMACRPGGFSHWHGIRICACLLGRFFAEFGIAIGGFHQKWRSPNCINWVYFGTNIVKSTQIGQNWVLFFRKWYIDGWENKTKNWYRDSQIFFWAFEKYNHTLTNILILFKLQNDQKFIHLEEKELNLLIW